MVQESLLDRAVLHGDIVYTPRDLASVIVKWAQPNGRTMDPCRGDGAFSDLIPGCEWCEIRSGRDFLEFRENVDWLIGNPPYSIYDEWMQHSFAIADNVCYLIPCDKVFGSRRRLREISRWGGIRRILAIGGGNEAGFPFGYGLAAFHFARAWRGATEISFT